jgi:serine/threonine protein kinase
MTSKGIYTACIPNIKIVPFSLIKNYKKTYPPHNHPKKVLLMEYLQNDLNDGICKNTVYNLTDIAFCNSSIIFSEIYPEIMKLVQTVASLNMHNFFHNDIKLENVMIANNLLYLVDFGLSFKMAKNGIIEHSFGTFPGELVYNFSIFSLRSEKYNYDTKYCVFLRKYLQQLSKVHFDQCYIAAYGQDEYNDYIKALETLQFISSDKPASEHLNKKYAKNIDSFGLGVVMLFIYSLSQHTIDHKYLDVVRLLLCQDVNKQISPIKAYHMLK